MANARHLDLAYFLKFPQRQWTAILHEREEQVFLVLTLVIGALTGLAVVAFILVTERFGLRLYPVASAAWRRLLFPVAGSLAMGILLYRFFPEARGSGVPQTKAALFVHEGRISLRTVLGKFFCTSATLASGIPLGREGPSVQVGAVLVGPRREVIQMGFNGFPEGIADTPERLNDRVLKNRLTVHAERNAVCLAARRGIATEGSTVYLAATDQSGAVWGGAPCVACLIELIQAGVREIVTLPFKTVPSRWADDIAESRRLIREKGMGYREVEF